MTSDRIMPGDIYMGCDYHPVLCTEASVEEDNVSGISLIDGSAPRSCSVEHCGVRKISIDEVSGIKNAWEKLFRPPRLQIYNENKAAIICNVGVDSIRIVLKTLSENGALPIGSGMFIDPFIDDPQELPKGSHLTFISFLLLLDFLNGYVDINEDDVFITELGQTFLEELESDQKHISSL